MGLHASAPLLQLRSELSEFAAKIEVATAYVANVGLEHQQHVQIAFAKVATAAVRQGDRVKTGQVLATLDTKRFDLSVIVKEVQPAFGPAIHP